MAQRTEHTTNAPSTPGDEPGFRYTSSLAAEIETRWQERWAKEGTFEAPNPAGPLAEPDAVGGRPKLFVLDMFPYPSGSGLHVGHPLGYIGTDVYARFKRMSGFNVLHALGYDAFGLPAEQYAIQTGTHPRETTEANVANMVRQLGRLGLGHDARRSVSTTDPEFYRWTQWIFLQIFNSFYDADRQRARPISELIESFEDGTRATPDGTAWGDLDDAARRTIVDDHRLVYLSDAPVNWCPGLGTVLANEEVTADGRSDRGNFPVFKRKLTQWKMRITAYGDRLIDDLDLLDWPEAIKSMQRNWIGRSDGARVAFDSAAGPIEVFTTRPDTLFGATFMVLAPEHPLVDELVVATWPAAAGGGAVPAVWTGGHPDPATAVAAYRATASAKSDIERQAETDDKTGVFTGSYATNPVNGRPVPVFIADYVLMGYGTGAIMAVPAGDHRDFAFARAHELPVVAVQEPPAAWFADHDLPPSLDTTSWPEAYVGEGRFVGSSNDDLFDEGVSLDGDRPVSEAKRLMIDWLVGRGLGEGTVNYKLRDWLFSRQRYWGEPFPIVYDDTGLPVALPDDQLPVLLPEVDDYAPRSFAEDDDTSAPEPPLARNPDWVNVTLDLGDGPKAYRRETNTMPQWAGSCWYELRYLDPTNDDAFVDPAVERYWMGPTPEAPSGGVDLYVGGVEHAVLHLLYARFWHKVLFDLGHVSSCEPFHRLYNQGYILADAFVDDREQYVDAFSVVERDGRWFSPAADGLADGSGGGDGEIEVFRQYGKMGKSLKNAVTPDDLYEEYGADTLRLYEMSMGPMDASRPWSTRDVVGMYRFAQRLWRNFVDEDNGVVTVVDVPAADETRRLLARTIDGVRSDMDGLRFNTAIAKLIELNNHLTKVAAPVSREVAEPLALMLAPLVPHLAEELWARLGHADTLTYEPFPEADPALLVADTVEIPIQVNGKVRSRVTVAADTDGSALEAAALADPKVIELLAGAAPRKVVAIPGRLVNIVL